MGFNPLFTQFFHHQLVFAKFDLSIYYPPPYERTVWYYNRANADLIRKAVNLFDWDKALRINDMDKQVALFSNILMNIMQNFLPNETIICYPRDAPWINKEIKQLTEQKYQFYKRFIRTAQVFSKNDLLASTQSGFRPGDSCINQLLSINHEIYQSFDNDLQVRGVFLDISKAFDKIWDEGLILKLSRNGTSENMLYLLKDFFEILKLSGQNSSWKEITSGTRQGSIFGPFLILISINALSNGLSLSCKLV